MPEQAQRADSLYFAVSGGRTTVTGGRATSSVERILLNLVHEIRNSLRWYNSPVPNRYQPDYYAQRTAGKIDVLTRALALLTRRPHNEALHAAVGVVAESATTAERAAIAWWQSRSFQDQITDLPGWSLWTDSANEDRDLGRLRQRLPYLPGPDAGIDPNAESLVVEASADTTIDAGTTPVVDQKKQESAIDAFRRAFEAYTSDAPEVTWLAITAEGLTWVDADGDEVWTADHSTKTAEAYNVLRLFHGESFIFNPDISDIYHD